MMFSYCWANNLSNRRMKEVILQTNITYWYINILFSLIVGGKGEGGWVRGRLGKGVLWEGGFFSSYFGNGGGCQQQMKLYNFGTLALSLILGSLVLLVQYLLHNVDVYVNFLELLCSHYRWKKLFLSLFVFAIAL